MNQNGSVVLKSNQDSPSKNKKPSNYRGQRVRGLYCPKLQEYKISRSKLELFVRCPRCFYLDRKLGVGHPPGYPFSLNNAVDELLKKEFDKYRAEQKPHPLCVENGIDAIPFKHESINDWRNSLHKGIQFKVPNTNIIFHGGLDDVWIDKHTSELFVVDYKATSKNGKISLDDDWQVSYKRQVEIYQWLLRKNNFKVSNTSYFVYCNGRSDLNLFDKKLHFDISFHPYIGDDSWVESAIYEAYNCLQLDLIPEISDECDYCQYLKGINNHCK